MGRLLSRVQSLALALGAPGLLLVTFLDSSFLSLPEATDLLLIWMVVQHKTLMPLYAGTAVVGSVAGSLVLYYIGRKGGDALVRSRYVDDAYDYTGQIFYSEIDMAYHSSGPHVDTTAMWDKVEGQLMPLPAVAGVHPQASFGHLMGGYDAGYYGYLWSKVYAQDLFTAFQQGGLENPAVGMRYRKDILEPARTYDPDVEVQRFLGRPMSPNAFYQEFENAPAPAPTGSPSP